MVPYISSYYGPKSFVTYDGNFYYTLNYDTGNTSLNKNFTIVDFQKATGLLISYDDCSVLPLTTQIYNVISKVYGRT